MERESEKAAKIDLEINLLFIAILKLLGELASYQKSNIFNLQLFLKLWITSSLPGYFSQQLYF